MEMLFLLSAHFIVSEKGKEEEDWVGEKGAGGEQES